MGHFEFGLDRQPVNTGDQARTDSILELWQRGEEVRGWARYWSQIYDYVCDRISANTALAGAVHITRFETLCEMPRDTLDRVFRHCELNVTDDYLSAQADRVRAPAYYQSTFSHEELNAIEEETATTVQRVHKLAD